MTQQYCHSHIFNFVRGVVFFLFEKFIAKLRYKFDNLMAKGTVALVAVLFLATAAFIVIAALIAVLLSGSTFAQNVWAGIMHTIDAGTITGTDTADIPYLIIMSAVTLCGLFVTSILIGIITTGFEEKLNSLKKGNSQVIENNHTLILGFNDNLYTIISELIEANASSKDECIVVLSPESKEIVEEAISGQIEDFQTTRIVCRTGTITDINMLKKCSISTCRSVIINEQNDFITTKAILAINNFFSGLNLEKMPCIVASVYDNSNYSAAVIAGEGNIEVMLTQDVISRIIAQTCRQSGLSEVMTELFDFDGDELYFENFPQLTGAKFGDVLFMFEKAVVFGYKRNGKAYLNPDVNSVIEENDEILLLMEDNGALKPSTDKKEIKFNTPVKPFSDSDKKDSILILGINSMLHRILAELDEYSAKGTVVTVASTDATDYISAESTYKNIALKAVNCDTSKRESLDMLANKDIENIVLLSNDDCDSEISDAQMLLQLIHLRDICDIKGLSFNITSEMKNPANQKLARVAKVNDFVVGNYIVNMMMAQISENRSLAEVFRELLSADGNEIYINNVQKYLDISQKCDFYAVTQSVMQHGEIALGYKKSTNNGFEIITNPVKSDIIEFNENDSIIVLAP